MTLKSNRPYRHVVWDWNGTLIDDARTCYEVLSTLLARYHKQPIGYETYLNEFDFPIIAYYERLGFDFSVESYDEIADGYISLYEERQFRCKLRRGAADVLAAVQRRGIAQSVLSAYHQSKLDEVVAFFELRAFFIRVVGRSDHRASGKLAQGQALARELALRPKETLLVGDTTHDCEVARALGVDCLLVADGHQCQAKIEACGVPVVESLDGILAYLDAAAPTGGGVGGPPPPLPGARSRQFQE